MDTVNKNDFVVLNTKNLVVEWNYYKSSLLIGDIEQADEEAQEMIHLIERGLDVLKTKDSNLEAYAYTLPTRCRNDYTYEAELNYVVLLTKLSIDEIKDVLFSVSNKLDAVNLIKRRISASYYIDYAGRRFDFQDVKERFNSDCVRIRFLYSE